MGGYAKCVSLLLEAGADAAATARGLDAGSCTALSEAATGGHVACIQLLLTALGPLPELQSIGSQALLSACMHGELGSVTALLRGGVHPTFGALDTAVRYGHKQCATVLQKALQEAAAAAAATGAALVEEEERQAQKQVSCAAC